MLNKWSNSLAEADFHRATLAWPSWSCVSFIFVVFLMAQQQQQRQPRLQDLLSRKVLEPAVQALSDVVTDEEQPAVHPFAGVWRDERALREAKIYILNKYAHINLEKEKLYESGAYPTSGMEEWVAVRRSTSRMSFLLCATGRAASHIGSFHGDMYFYLCAALPCLSQPQPTLLVCLRRARCQRRCGRALTREWW